MKVLLHICCAVCATCCVERLRQEGHEVSGYFYNPNIQPQEEYLRRLKETKKLASRESFPLIVGDYDLDDWFAKIKGLEIEPEGGKRCLRCFSLRLKRAREVAKKKSFSAFTTTLTVSPHKDAQAINEIGRNIDNGLFLPRDFKKQNGFKRAQELSRQYNFYHQNYCGCIYSLEARRYEWLHKKTCSSRHKG
jgi:predicted adenine nucleotide alpha hydrolase (AANH) superfamily ATPase